MQLENPTRPLSLSGWLSFHAGAGGVVGRKRAPGNVEYEPSFVRNLVVSPGETVISEGNGLALHSH
jgi:hypothetical protein